jgi:cytochrome c-type biogenesis protein CcmH
MSGLRLVGTVVAVLAIAGPLAAQERLTDDVPGSDAAALTDTAAAALDARAARIAGQLRCPVCTGQSVLESNSSIAQEMQAVIRERLDEGQTEQQILDYFVGSYGDWIILKPRAIGLNLLVYILPAVALVLGGAWLVTRLKKWSAGGGEAPEAASNLTDEDERWLKEAIRHR